METYPFSPYREVDNESPSLDEPRPNKSYKVKFMCSYGGKILPRPYDNNLAYVGGDTKILAVDRNIKFSAIMAKLSSLCNADVCFKYQLPGEGLDALISVTNEEDLEHMMVEYDRVCRASAKPGRLRLILFPLNASAHTNSGPNELKPERQCFVDALNSVQVEGSSPPAPVSATNPDSVFGLGKGCEGVPAAKLPDSAPAPSALDNLDLDDRQVVGEPLVSSAELQRLQLGNNEQVLQRRSDEGNGRVYYTVYYSRENPEKVAQAQAHSAPVPVPVPVHVPVSVQVSAPERHVPATRTRTEQPVYLIQTPSGMYQATTLRPIFTPVGQTYYAVPRMVPAAAVYNAEPPASLSYSQPKYTEAYSGYYAAAAAQGGVVTTGIDGRQGAGTLNQEGNVVTNISSAAV